VRSEWNTYTVFGKNGHALKCKYTPSRRINRGFLGILEVVSMANQGMKNEIENDKL